MNPYKVIIRPVDTEKTRRLPEGRQYVFEVDRKADKIEIKRAVESIYGVKVVAVNVMNMPAKFSGRRRTKIHPQWKKAVITLAEGQQLKAEGV